MSSPGSDHTPLKVLSEVCWRVFLAVVRMRGGWGAGAGGLTLKGINSLSAGNVTPLYSSSDQREAEKEGRKRQKGGQSFIHMKGRWPGVSEWVVNV